MTQYYWNKKSNYHSINKKQSTVLYVLHNNTAPCLIARQILFKLQSNTIYLQIHNYWFCFACFGSCEAKGSAQILAFALISTIGPTQNDHTTNIVKHFDHVIMANAINILLLIAFLFQTFLYVSWGNFFVSHKISQNYNYCTGLNWYQH